MLASGSSLIVFSACVSVSLGPKGASKSEGVRFRAPSSPFREMDTQGADKAWQNKNNGNTISYHSSCNDPADPTLETVQAETLSAFDEVRVINSAERTYNSREAVYTAAEGAVDGVKTRIDLVIFKKNHCTYTMSYVGVATRFAEDEAKFQEFLNSFGAP